jgi:rifampicin phosphotransferase
VADILTLRDRMTASRTGGKFSRQQEMIRAGIDIPPFFCLTGEFYQRAIAPHKVSIATIVAGADFSVRLSLDGAAERIRRYFTEGVSGELEEEIFVAFTQAFPDGPPVSVRASMIGFRPEESEDSSGDPFAGISESFLWVTRDTLMEKVRLSMASGFGAEAMLYRHRQGMNPTGFSVAVGIQRMAEVERSFVAFTCNPKTAARETVMIAGHGAGEGVVQERVPVDHYFFNPMSGEVRSQLAHKDCMLVRASGGKGLAMTEVPEALRLKPCLSADEIRRVCQLGARIERLFRAPQDIEGCLTGDGKIYILQSRPIAFDAGRQRVWTNANVTESFPGVTTPLTYTLARYFYRVIFYDCYRLLGIPRDELHDQHEALDRMIGYLGGRVYYSLTSFYRLHSQSPLFPIFRAHWEKMMGFLASYEIRDEGVVRRTARRMRSWLRLAKAVVVIAWLYLTHERKVVRFQRWWEELIAPRRGKSFETTDPLDAVADFHEVWRQVGRHWGVTLLNDTYLPVLYGWVESTFSRWDLSGGGLLSGLLCGDEGLVSVEIILSAVRLSEHVRSNPDLRHEFEQHSAETLWRRLDAGELDGGFAAAVRFHLERYGDRGFQELKVEQPGLRESPWVLLRMVQSYAREGLTEESFRVKERAERARAEAELGSALAGHPLRKRLLQALLAKLRKLIRNRENCRYCRSELFSYSKQVFAGIGHTFEADGVLQAAGDVYYLTQDEIFGYLDGTAVTENLQALVDLRRIEEQANRARETAMQITTMGPVRRNNLFAVPETNSNGTPLQGLGSSAGKVRGVARVVLDPNQPVDLGSNGILVARETDPGWLFLMLSSKGIIVERGSMLSHTAITGRKFGIPTVVSLPHATTRIADGAWVEVDGASGTVTILDEAGGQPS